MKTLCLGEALVDLVCDRPVAAFGEATSFVPHAGGAVAEVCVAAARRGAGVALAGAVGDDPWGRWLRDRLAREGVDLAWLRLLAGERTPVAFVTVDGAGEPSAVRHGDLGAAAAEALRPRLRDAVAATDALLVTTGTLVDPDARAATLEAQEHALRLGRPVVFDPLLRPAHWPSPGAGATVARGLLDGAFLVLCDRADAEALTGERDPRRAAASVLAGGARHVVVLGPDGAVLRGERGLRAEVPAPAGGTGGRGGRAAVTAALLAALAGTDCYPAVLGAALPGALAAGAEAAERWRAAA